MKQNHPSPYCVEETNVNFSCRERLSQELGNRMMRSTKELRHVYIDFLLEANQSYSDIVVLEADLSRAMATINLEKDFEETVVNVGGLEAEKWSALQQACLFRGLDYLHIHFTIMLRRVYLINYLFLLETHIWEQL